MKKERLVCVEWGDACYNSGYYDRDEPERFEPVLTKTVGHLVKSDRTKILVAQDRFENSDGSTDLRHIGTIPKKMVRRIRYLEDRKSCLKTHTKTTKRE